MWQSKNVWDRSISQEYPVTCPSGYCDKSCSFLSHVGRGINKKPEGVICEHTGIERVTSADGSYR